MLGRHLFSESVHVEQVKELMFVLLATEGK